MKKTLISTALRFVPKSVQYKALCKALNYLFEHHDLNDLKNKVVKLNVSDLKKSWLLTYTEQGFTGTTQRKADIELKTKFAMAFKVHNKAEIVEALNNEDIKLIGEQGLVDVITNNLKALDEKRLKSLSNHLFSFLNLKSKQPVEPAPLDINNITADDLATPYNIDFIRDEAIKLEQTDLQKALSLMLLAQQARPNGKVINNKVKDYQAKLTTSN
ncbi:hypothetical protein NQT72_13170 [Pseudoalteromonas carrageenovora]|uniref:hypothetical protein n=1 Tax=Pseudoalteromonas carrageenovora TaxID=227 RepID=UPI0021187FD8|nr:hypothetical protein [Pseudoalteromonas carrageenovora]MCQ8890455.1 hypothetical protein [Pseudoalteromonas carrageenovora]